MKDFYYNWKLHHPLSLDQIGFGNRVSIVKDVSYYHGGDELYELYELADIPGIWHEELLERA